MVRCALPLYSDSFMFFPVSLSLLLLFHFPSTLHPSPTFDSLLSLNPFLPLPSLSPGNEDDNRPGMRGGHQMVIDVQTGEACWLKPHLDNTPYNVADYFNWNSSSSKCVLPTGLKGPHQRAMSFLSFSRNWRLGSTSAEWRRLIIHIQELGVGMPWVFPHGVDK